MSVENDELERKYQNLERKYKSLRRNHKRLAGVALRLVEAVEALIKDDEKPDVNGILMSCSRMYPGLVRDAAALSEEGVDAEEVGDGESAPEKDAAAEVAVLETEAEATEGSPSDGKAEKEEEEEGGSGKEYFDGFWSRPKIPRTPQV